MLPVRRVNKPPRYQEPTKGFWTRLNVIGAIGFMLLGFVVAGGLKVAREWWLSQ